MRPREASQFSLGRFKFWAKLAKFVLGIAELPTQILSLLLHSFHFLAPLRIHRVEARLFSATPFSVLSPVRFHLASTLIALRYGSRQPEPTARQSETSTYSDQGRRRGYRHRCALRMPPSKPHANGAAHNGPQRKPDSEPNRVCNERVIFATRALPGILRVIGRHVRPTTESAE